MAVIQTNLMTYSQDAQQPKDATFVYVDMPGNISMNRNLVLKFIYLFCILIRTHDGIAGEDGK